MSPHFYTSPEYNSLTSLSASSWDDWVPQDRLRKFTEENRELANNLRKEMEALRAASAAASTSHAKRPSSITNPNAISSSSTSNKKRQQSSTNPTSSDLSSTRDSEERHSSQAPTTTTTTVAPSRGGPKRSTRDYETEREDAFHSRPAIRLLIPDRLKAILVDDWENVTKNLQLVRLPSPHPVNHILSAYLAEELPRRVTGSAEADILEEVVQGIREYFDKCLGRILLYRFERDQYFEVRRMWETATAVAPKGTGAVETPGKITGPGDVYGAEHLCRLFVSLPELVAQTNMDQQSVNRLKEELGRLTQWVGRGSEKWFTGGYEEAGAEYVETARGV